MTQYQLLQSIPVLSNLATLKLPVKKSYVIYNLVKKANEVQEFFIEEEKKLVEQHHAKVTEGGKISFEKPEDYQNFNNDYNELKNMEITGVKTIILKAADLGEQPLSASDLASLEGIVTIEEEEEDEE